MFRVIPAEGKKPAASAARADDCLITPGRGTARITIKYNARTTSFCRTFTGQLYTESGGFNLNIINPRNARIAKLTAATFRATAKQIKTLRRRRLRI